MNTKNIEEYIPLTECVRGHVYKIASRNLSYGVYDGAGGFIGIRNKFCHRYLFTEYHWDQGEPYGTVKPLEDLGSLPVGVEPIERFPGTFDAESMREVAFDSPLVEGGRGWYFVDTGESDSRINPITRPNHKLFLHLDQLRDE